MTSKTQAARIAKGLCPKCGKEAAPYYLCPECRASVSLHKKLKKMEAQGAIKSVRSSDRGRPHLWFAGGRQLDHSEFRVSPLWGEGKGSEDGRLNPRLGKIPVDVEKELIDIFHRLGEPLTYEEIMAAWGKLRVRRGRASAAGDLAALIKAERRRARRNQKRVSTGMGEAHA